VAQLAELLGKPLHPWQQHVANVALEVDPNTGLPAYDTVILVVMRQQGKTELMLPVMTQRAIGWDVPQRILYTTQTGSEARKKWEDIHVQRLKKSPLKNMFETRLRINAEAMHFENGSSWSPIAPTIKGGGTGDTVNLGVIDEAWSRPDNRTEVGMRPAMLTQPDRQLWITSMVPGPVRAKTVDSVYLRDKMDLGRAMVRNDQRSGVAYFEWSAQPGLDPGDPETWRSCMPGLNRTVSEKNVASDWETMSMSGQVADFCAEYLGWWPQDHRPLWQVIREPVWAALRDPLSSMARRFALAVDIDPERTSATIAVAGKRPDGDRHVEIVEPGSDVPENVSGVDWVERRLLELIDNTRPLCVALDPRGPARSLLPALERRKVKLIKPNSLEMAGACGSFYDATGQAIADAETRGEALPDDPGWRVRHLGQASLDRALAGARKLTSPTNGTFVFVRTGQRTSISPLYAAALALHGYEIMAPADYDILKSVY
jgi:hypothetical protein